MLHGSCDKCTETESGRERRSKVNETSMRHALEDKRLRRTSISRLRPQGHVLCETSPKCASARAT
eukprot:4598143-Alexandrium_andersonii.AAC.2